MGNWLYVYLGIKGFGPWYGFWSGFAGIMERLVELAVIGWVLLRKHNCHQPGCPFIGRFPGQEQGWHYCRRHHQSAGAQPSREV